MNKPRPCGCKGCRTCLICEETFNINQDSHDLDPNSTNVYYYCPFCNLCYPGWDVSNYKTHPIHDGEPLVIHGLFIQCNFLNQTEHDRLINDIDSVQWDCSQSGRRKQNYGPKCNFKKRKLRLGDFHGFPLFSKFVQDKFQSVDILKNFQTIEQCSLEYDPDKGASIDSHVDDCWIWGERVVTVNLLDDTVLTLTYNSKPTKYNLDLVGTYPKVLNKHGQLAVDADGGRSFQIEAIQDGVTYPIIRVPMLKYSLFVMYDEARYNYEHRILREDIRSRRVCLAYREFTPPYLKDGEYYYGEGEKVIEMAKRFEAVN